MKKRFHTKGITIAAVIAALYVVLTLPFGQIAFGPIQFRIGEILTLLPFFTPWAIPGVTVGCLISNLLFSTVWDVLFGSSATLIAAWFTHKSKHLLVAPIWPILFNGLLIGTMIAVLNLEPFAIMPWLLIMGEITASEFVVCFGLGVPFMRYVQQRNLFK